MRIYRSTLIEALSLAIEIQEEVEKKRGYTVDSAKLKTWRDLQKEIENGSAIYFRD